jgi:chorismate synthase
MNSFGTLFRLTSWGESHGPAVGGVIDGCPAGLLLDETAIAAQLARRRTAQSLLTSSRRESDAVRLLSGLYEGRTTGTPIAFEVANEDAKSEHYATIAGLYRPSHADFTYEAKFGHRDPRGGGRASARETVARVIAGTVAEQLLREQFGVEVVAWVSSVASIGSSVEADSVTRAEVDRSAVRCPDATAAAAMEAEILTARSEGDTVGGTITCVARGLPAGWGEPVFGKLEAELARAMLSLPACKGFESGSGFDGARMRGSAHNDDFVRDGERITTATNRSGGIQGGISNGAPVLFRAAFKPVATHFQPQQTVTRDGEPTTFTASGRHDPCVVPRAVPMVEAMAALTLLDAALLHRARSGR